MTHPDLDMGPLAMALPKSVSLTELCRLPSSAETLSSLVMSRRAVILKAAVKKHAL